MGKNIRTLVTYIFGWILLSSTGCSHTKHNKVIIGLQKNRIEKLEKHNRKQERLIEKLKARVWSRPVAPSKRANSTLSLDSLIQQKKWVSALKKSSELKSRFPKSKKVREARIFILRKMGLFKEADIEKKDLASFKKKSIRRKL